MAIPVQLSNSGNFLPNSQGTSVLQQGKQLAGATYLFCKTLDQNKTNPIVSETETIIIC